MTQTPPSPRRPGAGPGPSIRRRWGRTWRSRLATGAAGVIGVAAGAGVIAATNGAPSSGAVTKPADGDNVITQPGTTETVTPPSQRPRSVYRDDDRDDHDEDDDDDGYRSRGITSDDDGGARVGTGADRSGAGGSSYQTPTRRVPRPQGSTRASR